MSTRYDGPVVAIYARISADRTKKHEGVDAQIGWGRAYAEEHWPGMPVEVFCDNDASAASDDLSKRPEFRRFLRWVGDGRVAHIWASWHNRLSRNEEITSRLRGELRRAGIKEIHTRHDGVRGIDDIGTKIVGLVDDHYVLETQLKVIDKHGVLAKEGRPGPGVRMFGYRWLPAADHKKLRDWQHERWKAKQRGEDPDEFEERHPRPQALPLLDDRGRKTTEICEDEAAAIRDIAQGILRGWTISRAVEELSRRGLYGRFGAPITTTTLRGMLAQPALAGLRLYHDEVIGKANWHDIAVLDEQTWRAVNATLDSNDRYWTRSTDGARIRIGRQRRTMNLSLLGAFARCGICGETMFGGGEAFGRPIYRCRAHGYIEQPGLDRFVRDRLFEQLEKPEFFASLTEDDDAARREEIVAELEALDGRRLEANDMWNAGELTTEMFRNSNRALIDEQRTLSAELADLPVPRSGDLDLADVRATWKWADGDERRMIITRFIDDVLVGPAWVGHVSRGEVARAAGVSRASVDAVINGDRPVSEKMRARVLAAAAEVGYDPNDPNPQKKGAPPPIDDKRITIRWRE